MDLETFRAIDVDIDLANDFVPDVILSANDYNGRCIVARVTNGGVNVSGDNLSARLLFNTAPGISVGGYVTMTRVASSPTATWQVPVPSDALAARQVMLCVQIVDSDDNLVCSRNFRGIVDRKLMDDDAPESVNELNRLWEGIDALENIDASVTADGTVSVTAPDGTVTTSTAVPTAVSAANSATSAANTAATAANNAAGTATAAANTASQTIAALQAFVPLDADNILKASETGAIVSTNDAYPSPLLGLTVYGNSVQDGTPTPETPVPIKSVARASVGTSDENLLTYTSFSRTNNGITFTVNEDGTISVSGTATADAYFACSVRVIPIVEGQTYSAKVVSTDEQNYAGVAFYINTSDVANAVFTGTYVYNSSALRTGVASQSGALYVRVRVVSGTTLDTTLSVYFGLGDSAPSAIGPIVGSLTPLTLIDDQGVAHELRSLPDGTRDELRINVDGSGTLVENVLHAKLNGTETGYSPSEINGVTRSRAYVNWSTELAGSVYSAEKKSSDQFSSGSGWSSLAHGQWYAQQDGVVFAITGSLTSAELKAWMAEHTPEFNVKVTGTPATYHIPAINMPSLPDLVSNAWISATDADGAAIAADIGITYRRDINKVISDLETAIADIVSA